MPSEKIICHISFNHSAFDDRIYWKELLSLKKAGFATVHIAVDDKDTDFISEEGIQIITVKRRKLVGNMWLNKALQALFKKKGTVHEIFKIAKSLKASVYHYHDLQINAIAKDLKQLPQQPKVIYDAHEAYHLLMTQREHEPPLSFLIKKIVSGFITRWEIKNASFCDLIITTDQYTFDYFNRKLPGIRRKIIYNYSFFYDEETVSSQPKKYDLIYAGQLSKKRGIKEIVQSTYHCISAFPDISVLLIGYFDSQVFEKEIRETIEKLGLAKNVILKQMVSFQEIRTYYEASKIGLCLLYNTPKYTTAIPIKLFEYMSFGLPVIVSDHGVTAEIVQQSDCGLLVDVSNIEDIAKAISKLLHNKELYQLQSGNGQKKVQQVYNWKNESLKLIKLYARFLS